GRDNYRCGKLQYLGPASTKWNRPFANDLLSEITWRLYFTKFRSDGAVRSALLAHPFRKVRIAASMRQRFLELGIGVINWPAIKQQPLFGFARIHVLWQDEWWVSVKSWKRCILPRAIRDCTVPSGISNTSAISL